MTYAKWMAEVDKNIIRLCGLTSEDLPDYRYHDEYEDGETPLATARRALKAAKEY